KAGQIRRVAIFGLAATNGSSTNRCGGSVPVHTAPVMCSAESFSTSSCHPGTSPNDVTCTSGGNRISTLVVATGFSLGTRSTYFSYAPVVEVFGNTTACAKASPGTSTATGTNQRRLGRI